MIEGKFDSRTLTAMNVALDKVCARVPGGEDHTIRKRAAKEIVRSAAHGQTGMDQLIAAGERGLYSGAGGPALFDRQSRRTASH